MNIKRVISMAAAASLGLTMLASCGGSESTDSGSDAKKVELTVYTNRTDRVDDGSLAKLTESFEKDNNCTVKYIGFTDYSNDIKTKMTSGDYGDVLAISDDVKVEELGNYFEPLGTYDELSQKYLWANKKMTSDKTVYGLAYGGNATGFVYNKKVWADAGITETPKTPEDFIAALKKIKESNENVVPFYTNYKDSWCTGQWDGIVIPASGSASYKEDIVKDNKAFFDKDGGYYKTYKLMFDVYSEKDLMEADHSTTDWEKSKQYIADGNVATICAGSWAISQFQAFAEGHEDDIGYMPAPFTAADGKQYSVSSGDYCYGVSKNSKNIDLAKKFVEWFVSDSGFAAQEGMICTAKGADLPENLASNGFTADMLLEEPLPAEEYVGKFDAIDSKSGVGASLTTTDNFKIKMAEAAFAGKGEDEFNKIVEETNKKWADAYAEIMK
ncbi:MAG: ABC transporter substrate-binding protein [Oscillospiraceae bacterium]